mmetsp:Transcript_9921/g.36993  ORF Transcript_9921/g.36993 Transcript_9921/m.36993 type:complete len:93 (-) Transcript_9921:595-873(-)
MVQLLINKGKSANGNSLSDEFLQEAHEYNVPIFGGDKCGLPLRLQEHVEGCRCQRAWMKMMSAVIAKENQFRIGAHEFWFSTQKVVTKLGRI